MAKTAGAAVTCAECYFRRAGLCALPTDTPCPTFRAHTRGSITKLLKVCGLQLVGDGPLTTLRPPRRSPPASSGFAPLPAAAALDACAACIVAVSARQTSRHV